MHRSWWRRVGVIAAVHTFAVWMLAPSVLPAETIAAHTDYFPRERLNLATDLQGGVEMVLDVRVEEAVFSTLQRDAYRIKHELLRDGVSVGDVRRKPGAALLLIEKTTPEVDAAVAAWIAAEHPGYRASEDVEVRGRGYAAWRPSAAWRQVIEQGALRGALRTLSERLPEAPGAQVTVEEGYRIRVSLPGVEDLR